VIRGLYSAAAGMQGSSLQQDATAHNLSHAVKPGYLREVLRFDATGLPGDLQGPTAALHTDFSSGTLEFTGNKLEVALNGAGFFSVEGPAGPLYTRNGVFQLNAEGQLVTMDGLAALGTDGPITLPPGTAEVEILGNGGVVADGIEVGQLKVTNFDDPSSMQRVGTSYFSPLENASQVAVIPEVRQGYRELSNTSMVEEMVQMIFNARHFDASQRALRTIGDAIAYNTRPLTR
jgi:flagellar basal-body rod protein FlgF